MPSRFPALSFAALSFAALACACAAPRAPHATSTDGNATAAGERVEPCAPLPSPRQLAWHALEHYAFVHFNMDTFTGAEWGKGTEDPRLFAPSALDCRQWARVARAAGMSAIILTAKHHDGFCLWPSRYSTHTVAQSAWRNGKGDVLRELSDACREQGLKFGVYLSPWDRNSKDYGSGDAYNQYFANQLTEVLTQYGPVFEVWFDGACGEGPSGKRQVYDWKLFHDTVRRCQPDAVIFSDVGPDVRWMGNEQGLVGATNWALLDTAGFEPGANAPLTDVLNSGQIDGAQWIPAECDVSIRPGWYYHAEQDESVKSLEHLQEIWYGSVGRGANLLLNLPVDRRGLVHENDVERLLEFKAWRDATFARDLAAPARARSRSAARDERLRALFDGNPRTFVAAEPNQRELEIHVEFDAASVSVIEVGEPLELGQRIARFSVRGALDGAAPRELARGTTIGRKRLLRIDPQRLDELWISIEDARARPLLSTLALYDEPPRVGFSTRAREFVEPLFVELRADGPDCEIRYTLDGTRPTDASMRYAQPLQLSKTTTIQALCTRTAADGARVSGPVAAATFRRYARAELRAPVVFIRAPDTGLRCAAYELALRSLAALDAHAGTDASSGASSGASSSPASDAADGAPPAPVSQRVCDTPSVELATRHGECALVFSGFVRAPADSIYTFELASDDGSRLWIGDELVVDNDGVHALTTRSGKLGLQQGWHPFRLAWFDAGGERALALRMSRPDGGDVPLVFAR